MEYTFQMTRTLEHLNLLIKALGVTVTISLLSIIIGLITGWIVAVFRVFGGKLISTISGMYIEFWRNTPLLIQVFFLYFGITSIINFSFSAFQAGLIAIILNTTAYNAEIIRGGIQSIPKIQIESAQSLGLNFFQILRTIIIPYVNRIVFPSLVNQFILIILGTSLLSIITVNEMMNVAKGLQAITGRTIEIYLLVGVLYIILISLFSLLMKFLEKKIFFIHH